MQQSGKRCCELARLRPSHIRGSWLPGVVRGCRELSPLNMPPKYVPYIIEEQVDLTEMSTDHHQVGVPARSGRVDADGALPH